MNAVVDSVIRFPSRELHPKAREVLQRELSFPNPEYVNRVRFNRWVGSTPEEITLVDERRDGWMSLPRGAVNVLRSALSAVGYEIIFEDQRTIFPLVKYESSLSLRDYQQQATHAFCRHTQGCIVIPCGGGKTVVGVAVIVETGQPTIVLVHTHDLLEQWKEMIAEVLGIEAGIIAEGKYEPKNITIATVQSLAIMDEDALTKVGRQFGLVILDEAHHAPAAVFRSVMSKLSGKYRLGLTATPDRADGLTPLLEFCIGPILYEVNHDRLVDAGHLMIPQIVSIETGIECAAETHTAMVSELIDNDQRNRMITELATQEAKQGKTVLILSGRVEHCRHLARLIEQNGVAAEALTGDVPKSKRNEILSRFRAGSLSIVCATTLADEGLDISRLERLILATPAKAEGRTIQRLGRLMRPHPGKDTPNLYDFVDNAPMAQRQFNARRRAYAKVLGKEALKRSNVKGGFNHFAPEDNDEGPHNFQTTESTAHPFSG